MRLFIAFDISEEAISILKDIQKRLNIKATFVKEFHLTLKFLGEVEESKVESIIQELSKIKFDSFDAGLSNVGVFPDRKYIKVVWIGLEPHDNICALQKQVDQATRNFGIAMDKDFVPHLTLARIKFIENKKEFLDAVDNIKVEKSGFKVSSFKLVKSTLTPQGPIYEVLKEFSAQ
jgi:2'-5' RNA ligase